MRCQDFVEQVTDYLEGAVTEDDRTRIEEHLAACGDCDRVLAQWREVIRLTGRLGEDQVDGLEPATRDELLAAFRARPPAPD